MAPSVGYPRLRLLAGLFVCSSRASSLLVGDAPMFLPGVHQPYHLMRHRRGWHLGHGAIKLAPQHFAEMHQDTGKLDVILIVRHLTNDLV